jgi:hypothetical protein
MTQQSVKAQVVAGLRKTGAWLAGMFWFGLVTMGIGIVFRPDQAPYPPVIGWLLLALGAIVLILTTDRWIKVLPGILGAATISGIIITLTGHELNHPEIHVSAAKGAFVTFFVATSAILSSTFVGRSLHIWDRCALFGFVFCLFWQVAAPQRIVQALAIGLACLLAAWVCNNFMVKRKRQSNRATSKFREV